MHAVPLPRGEFQAAHLTVQSYATPFLDHMGAGMLVVLQNIGKGHVALGATAIDGNAEKKSYVV